LLLRKRTGYGSAAPLDRVAFDQAMLKKDKSTVRGVIAQAAAVSAYIVTTDRVATLTMPALVLHGDEDGLVPFAWAVELAKTLPNARLVTLHGAGHNFMVARGEETATALLDFVRGVEPGVVAR
jgi:pimeloyl-ACP methyl ester carboxylesterase